MALIRRGFSRGTGILLKEVDRVKVNRTFKYGAHDVTIETGGIARQADGAVLVSMGDTVVLVTAVGEKGQGEARSFFPLTVNYQEKTYAAGDVQHLFSIKTKLETMLKREKKYDIFMKCMEFIDTRIELDNLGIDKIFDH